MISHERIWGAIDAIAARNGLSVSGLARRAGLDPTAFNKSKRIAGGGRLRWPTTESLAKILDATGTTPEELAHLLRGAGDRARRIADAAPPAPGFSPATETLAAIRASSGTGPVLVYEVPDGRFEPVYRAGDRLLVDPSAPVEIGARIVVVDRDGAVHGGEVTALSEELALALPGSAGETRRARRDVAFAARILWASQ